MKHSLKITLVLLAMFFLAQLIGLFVINAYSPEVQQVVNESGDIVNLTIYNMPYGTEPPADIEPSVGLISILIALIIAIGIMFLLMHFGAETIIRLWFFIVVTLALAMTIYTFIPKLLYAPLIALAIAIPFSFFKVFKRNIIIHNITELFIYPGLAAIFVPLLSIFSVILLLVAISVYDIYAVWHSGIMQKMAKYQIKKVRIFTGFFVPYLGKKERDLIKNTKASKLKGKKIKMNVAILGGGDVVFPIILSGVILRTWGLFDALLVSIGATAALGILLYYSDKGKFYPAMPFISAGCFIALLLAYFI